MLCSCFGWNDTVMERLVVSFEFGQGPSLLLDEDWTGGRTILSSWLLTTLAGNAALSKFSIQHSHNTSFGPHSPLLLRATPSLIFAFRAISGDVKDVFVTVVSKIDICVTHFLLPIESRKRPKTPCQLWQCLRKKAFKDLQYDRQSFFCPSAGIDFMPYRFRTAKSAH